MKNNENFLLTVLMMAILLSTVSLSANTPLQNIQSTSQIEWLPPKKKCRKCSSRFHPDRMFKKGQLDATFGVGLVPTFLMDGAKVKMFPLALGLEYRFGEKFSLGMAASYSVSESKPKVIGDGFYASWTNSFTQITLRPAVHVTQIEDWDFYGGFAIGLNSSQVNGKSNSNDAFLQEMEGHLGIQPSRTSGTFYGFAGVRYVLSPKCMVGGEIGFGASIFSIGFNYLLN